MCTEIKKFQVLISPSYGDTYQDLDVLDVSEYIALPSNNKKQYLTESMETRDMWLKPMSQQHAAPLKLGTTHEPTKYTKSENSGPPPFKNPPKVPIIFRV